MRIFITGAGGFIATHLADFLKLNGHEVDGGTSRELFNANYHNLFFLKLGDSLPKINKQYDWVIHCAYDNTLSAKFNCNATIIWADEFLTKGIAKKQLFISTIGTVSGNTSEYALSKILTEKWFRAHQLNIVRPGLVIGEGGLFKNILKKIESFPIIPLVDGGKQKIKLIGINDLLNAINETLIYNREKEQNFFYSEMPSLSDLLRTLAMVLNRKIYFVPIPFILLYAVAWSIEKIHLNIGISTVNFRGLRNNQVAITNNLAYSKTLLETLKNNIKLK